MSIGFLEKNKKIILYFFNDIFLRFFLTLEQNVLYLFILEK